MKKFRNEIESNNGASILLFKMLNYFTDGNGKLIESRVSNEELENGGLVRHFSFDVVTKNTPTKK